MTGGPAPSREEPAAVAVVDVPPETGEEMILSGWGGWPRSGARVIRPRRVGDLVGASSARGLVPRGLGRSYGDASQLSGGTVIDMTGISSVDLDAATGLVTAGGGTSLGDIISAAMPRGWFLPVTPGTRHVTVGGAIAADVHGKNHHRDGTFGNHVERLMLLTGNGRKQEVVPGERAFAATVGGMGLTGIILDATIRLRPVATSWMRVDTFAERDLPAVMDRLLEVDRHSRYSVAWLDMTPGRHGRGVVMAGDHAELGDLPPRHRRRPLARTPMRELPTPSVPAFGLVDRATVATFNRLWFERVPRRSTGRLEPLDRFFYPLDRLAGWPAIYGPAGFLQYQFVVPPAAVDTLLAVAEVLTRASTPVSLAVLKRMGKDAGGSLSFPMEGWTLSADMPLGDPSLGPLLDGCDRLVAEAGGRVYLAKDARMRPELMARMYPELDHWIDWKQMLDPDLRIRSDLSDRLHITT